MKLSIVVPAFNEEKRVGACLHSVARALRECARPGLTTEVIVCDNNSTDRTPDIARSMDAQVVFEPVNQISRARNAGARQAAGDWILFIDADSELSPRTLSRALAAMESPRCAGGGCFVEFDVCPWHTRMMVQVWNGISRTFDFAAGSFVFCRADAFRAVGGFSTELFAAEEIRLSIDLQHWARRRGLRFTILTGARHVSSGRKAGLYGKGELLLTMARIILSPRKALGNPKALGLFYDGRR